MRRATVTIPDHLEAELDRYLALTAVLSEELDLPVWTYDHHFDVMASYVWR
jgi:hypothetical protein